MRRRRSHAYGPVVALGLLLGAGPGAAGANPPPLHVARFDQFIDDTSPICQFEPAATCLDRAWDFADADGDDGLSLAELQAIRIALRDWVVWRSGLTRTERAAIALGLLMADGLGLERVHAAYDLDGDGWIDRAELLTDVQPDGRPIGQVLLDPARTDHAAIARRLGLPEALVGRIRALTGGGLD
jgi:hypothetical protein